MKSIYFSAVWTLIVTGLITITDDYNDRLTGLCVFIIILIVHVLIIYSQFKVLNKITAIWKDSSYKLIKSPEDSELVKHCEVLESVIRDTYEYISTTDSEENYE